MKNLSIKTRLFLLVGMLMMLLLISVASTIVNLRKSNAVLQTVYNDRIVPLRQLMAVAAGFGVNVVDAAHKVRDGAMSADEGLKSLAAARQSIDTHWTAYTATFLEPEEKLLVAKAEPLIKAAHDADRRLEALLVAKDIEGLREFAAKQLYPAIDPVGDIVDQLSKIQLEVAKREYEAGQAEYTRVLWTNVSIAALALLAAGVMAWLLIRAVLSGISQAVKVAETVAAGDLSSRIEVDRRDETGQLLGALRRMNDALVLIVGDVRNASDSIATGSTQIATGNADLSQRTEEQASNLQQTAASMEQLTATVKQNADTARQANQLAISASAVAAQGGQVVERVVATMQDITDSSKKIVDIIGVIDGIAFQTNILALNAAVEAARAGEQGRGFAVVAGEVRNLAQRSAAAAKEIKSLIGDSVVKVETGSALVGDAGKTMDEIVAQVKRVSDLIGEISAASIEQSTGIGQIGDAVSQLDQVTQQNAALVEESAAAAESLKHQAVQLAQTVAVFRL